MPLRSVRVFLKIISLVLFSFPVSGQDIQKVITRQSLAVTAYSSNLNLSAKWSLSMDLSERVFMDPVKQSQMFFKTQLGFEPFKNFSFGNGIAYYLNSPGDPEFSSVLKVPEVRLNHDLGFSYNLKSIHFSHRYRMEERFIRKKLDNSLIDGFRFVERISYMLSVKCKLLNSKNHDHDIYLNLSDGIYANTHQGVIYDSFDQNRFYAGLNYQVVKNLTIELGYINLYQQRIYGVEYLNRNIASLGINHSIKLHH